MTEHHPHTNEAAARSRLAALLHRDHAARDEQAALHKLEKVAEQAADQVKARAQKVREARAELRHVPRRPEVQAYVQSEIARHLDRHVDHDHEVLERRLSEQFEQQREALDQLNKHLRYMNRHLRRRGGGFPWPLLLLAGAGYYVWRTPQLREKVLDAAEQIRPGITAKLRGGAEHGEARGPAATSGVTQLHTTGSAAQVVARVDPQLQVDASWPQTQAPQTQPKS
ncbi:hypothetical protein [Deinococcus hopiensis]|uniref:Uncharacterized protein n=1 Tax=Deinococcus hopiensis KR-140 TaxID=695939 RepID=A0A1W1UDV7_9DEIO|nr:hypothetical protein [Deinococcus hopiensis]SMB79223.1 hypothetical protein SAMN00790413_05839 [Deinococcus hopiensis KR-140]